MLEELFGNKIKVKLLKLFLLSEEDDIFCDVKMEAELGEKITAIKRELDSLAKLDLILVVDFELLPVKDQEFILASKRKEKPKYYRLNQNFIFCQNLKDIFLRSRLLAEKYLAEHIDKLGNVKLLVLSGYFVNDANANTDILIVGQVDKNKLSRLVAKISREYGHELRYTHFSTQEFNYRNRITDKFLFEVLEGKKIVVVDRVERNIKMN